MKTSFRMAGILWAAGVAGMLMAGAASADILRLKNGSVVEGKIIEKMADSVKVDIGGVALTYYNDEIDAIEPAAEVTAPVVAAAEVPVVEAPALDAPAAGVAAEAIVPVTEAPAVPVASVVEPAVTSATDPAPAVQSPVGEVAAAAPVPVVEAVAAPVAPAVEPAVTPVAVAALPVDEVPARRDEFAGMPKNELIQKFVEIYGVKENMQSNFDQMTTTLDAKQAKAFRDSIKVTEIVQALFPIYDRYFSESDLRSYIRFYSSPEGRKLVQTLPLLMKDSVDVSMKYLEDHLPESLKNEQAPAAGK